MKNLYRIMLLLCLAALVATASAEGRLSADLEGNRLSIRWPVDAGPGRITVTCDGWLLRSLAADESGEATLCLDDATGRIAVRLEAEGGRALTARAGSLPVRALVPCGTASLTSQSRGTVLPGLAAQVIREVNLERARRGLRPLRTNPELTRAAAVRAAELAILCSHTRPDGTRWTTVSASALGENIARGQRSADRVMAAWMSSAGHRANILRPGYGSIGVCAVVRGGIVHWAQLFGR